MMRPTMLLFTAAILFAGMREAVAVCGDAPSLDVRAQGELRLSEEQPVAVTADPCGVAMISPARWRSQIGRVTGGRFDAGDRRAPAVAIVAAEADAGGGSIVRGAALVRVIGEAQLQLETSPGASVSV